MQEQERLLIENLAQRLKSSQVEHVDVEANDLINKLIASEKNALYLLTQAVLLQEQALTVAQEKINELEDKIESLEKEPQKTSFLGGLFGNNAAKQEIESNLERSRQSAASKDFDSRDYASSQRQEPPIQRGQFQQGAVGSNRMSGGSSFLAQAASTAAGVAGGALLFQGISHLFSGSSNGFLAGSGQTSETVNNETINNETINNANVDDSSTADHVAQNDSYLQDNQLDNDFSSDWGDDGGGFGFDDFGGDDW